VGTAVTEGLIRYSAACRAIALARATDEVLKIRNQGAMLRAYAKQAKNRHLEIDAVEIRIRAERRVGELIEAQNQTIGLNRGVRGKPGPGRGKRGSKLDPRFDDKPTLAEAGIDKHLADRARKLAKVPQKRFNTLLGDWRNRAENEETRVTADVLRPKQAVHQSSETPEHYTPRVILDAAIACLGEIDLDPCSNPGAPNVEARQRFTKDDNGLSREWHGRVYMNPPYGRQIEAWIEKLCAECECGRLIEAIALLPARTDTQWFKRLRNYPCCFIEGRLTFIGNEDVAPFPSVVFYLGENLGAFYFNFSALGDIWQRVEPGVHFGD
jgi:hypothetical protein